MGVYRTICRVSWGCLGVILKVFGSHFGEGNWRKKGSPRLFKIELNSLFNDQGVFKISLNSLFIEGGVLK